MDTLLTLLIMGILYVVPRIWKTYLEKINKNQEVPVSGLPAVSNGSSQEEKISKPAIHISELPLAATSKGIQNISNQEGEKSAWHGKVDHNMLVNGVIFAEILQPPRAYRPFIKR